MDYCADNRKINSTFAAQIIFFINLFHNIMEYKQLNYVKR